MPRRGEKISAETVSLANKSRHSTFLSKMDWRLCEPYLDTVIDNGSSGRSRTFITFRQFKERAISGESHKEMVDNGVATHLVTFMSNFCQGKILFSCDDFIKEYRDGQSLNEIAKNHGITQNDIIFLRQLYNIKRRGATYQKRKETEVPITQRQKELVYGSLMGDAKKMSDSSVGFGQGDKQREYLMWKYNEMYSVISKPSLKRYESIDKRNGANNVSWRCYTYANSDIEAIIKQFYSSGTKEVTTDILDNLTAFSVAIWFMDDGKTDFYYRTYNYGINHTPTCTFCTESFSHESCVNIQKWFSDKWQIRVRIKEQPLKNRMGYRIIVENEDTEKFFDLVRPHILQMFQYKIDYTAYVRMRDIWRDNELV